MSCRETEIIRLQEKLANLEKEARRTVLEINEHNLMREIRDGRAIVVDSETLEPLPLSFVKKD